MVDDLKRLPLFESLTDGEAAQLAVEAAEVSVAPGEKLFPGFEVTSAFWVLLEGRWRVVRHIAGQEEVMFEADRPGTWTGGVPLVDAIAPVRAEVLAPSRFLAVPIPAMNALAGTNPGTARRLLEAIEWGAQRIGGALAAKPLAFLFGVALLVAVQPAAAQDYHARDDAAPLMTAGLLDRKDALPLAMFTRYWRDVHGPLAARISGFHQYWQHHLGAPVSDYWPIRGVAQHVHDASRVEGFAETTFRSADDRARLGDDPAAQLLFHDEQNAFRATYLCPSDAGDSRTLLDRYADAAPQGRVAGERVIVLVRAQPGTDRSAFRAFVGERLGPALARAPGALKVRLHLLQPYDAAAWNTPGVRHDLPVNAQYAAILELAFRDPAARRRALLSGPAAAAVQELPRFAAGVDTYPEVATYTMVADGRPTLAGLKGLPIAEAILAAGARNQVSPDILRLLNGTDQPPVALAWPSSR